MNHERLYLQAASRAVFCDDADVGWIDAGADKTGQMLILHISHLENKHTLSIFNSQYMLTNILKQNTTTILNINWCLRFFTQKLLNFTINNKV